VNDGHVADDGDEHERVDGHVGGHVDEVVHQLAAGVAERPRQREVLVGGRRRHDADEAEVGEREVEQQQVGDGAHAAVGQDHVDDEAVAAGAEQRDDAVLQRRRHVVEEPAKRALRLVVVAGRRRRRVVVGKLVRRPRFTVVHRRRHAAAADAAAAVSDEDNYNAIEQQTTYMGLVQLHQHTFYKNNPYCLIHQANHSRTK